MKRKIDKCKVMASSIATTALLLGTSLTAYADTGNNKYAKNASDWAISGIQVLVLAGAAFIIGKNLINRKFVHLIVSIVISAIIVALVYNPMMFKSIGDHLVGILFG